MAHIITDEQKLTAIAVAMTAQSRKRAGMAAMPEGMLIAQVHHWRITAKEFYREIMEDAAAILIALDKLEK